MGCEGVCIAKYHPIYHSFNGISIYPFSSKDIIYVSCVDDTGKYVYLTYYKYIGLMP